MTGGFLYVVYPFRHIRELLVPFGCSIVRLYTIPCPLNTCYSLQLLASAFTLASAFNLSYSAMVTHVFIAYLTTYGQFGVAGVSFVPLLRFHILSCPLACTFLLDFR